MNIKTILTLAKKEWKGFLNSSLFYVIVIPFLLISTFLYFRTTLASNDASLRAYFDLLPWLLLFLAPALSMRLLTDEHKSGTLELIQSHPVSEEELVLGKFAGVLGIFSLILLATMGLPLSLLVYSNADFGVMIGQYLGALFLGASFLSIGLAASSLTKNSIASFLSSAAASFSLILIGLDMVVLALPWPVNRIISEIAIFPHTDSVSRGLVDIRDIAYFITLSGLFLSIAIWRLSENKASENRLERIKLRTLLVLVLIIGIGANFLLLKYPYRLDLTKEKLFTLSKGSKQTLKSLPDTVSVDVYASRNLPGQMQLRFKAVEDLLKDYKRYGEKLEINKKYPDTDNEALKKAQEEGVEEMTFNRIGSSKFEVQTGYLGLVIKYKDKTETIPFVEDVSDLEYQLTRRIRKLTNPEEAVVGIWQNDYTGQYQILEKSLGTQYKVKTVSLTSKDELEDLKTLIVINNPQQPLATESGVLKEYLNKESAKALVFSKGVSINPQLLSAEKADSQINQVLLEELGIQVDQDLVYDVGHAEPIVMGNNQSRYIVPYPFWFKAVPGKDSLPALSSVSSILLGWPSSISWKEKEGVAVKPQLMTAPSAAKLKENFSIDPNKTDLQPSDGKEVIAIGALAQKDQSDILVFGDFNFISDQFIQNHPENLSLLANLVDYLAADPSLSSIPRKVSGQAVFKFSKPLEPLVFQYGNILIPSVAVALFAFWRLGRRKKLTLREY